MNIYRKYKEIIMYLIFGALTTFVSLVTYYLCTATVFNPEDPFLLQAANVITWIVSVTFAFVTNKKYVFNSADRIMAEALKFYAARLTTLAVDMLLMYILVTVLEFDDFLVKTLVQIVVIVGNYVLSRFVVFKNKEM